MALAFVYASDYQLVMSRGLTIEEGIQQGYLVWVPAKDTHTEMYNGHKVRCLN